MRWYQLAGILALTFVFSMYCDAQGPLQVSATNLPSSTTTNVKSAQIVNLNLFRYSALPNVQDKTANPPSPPAGFMPPAGAGGGAAAPAAAPPPPAPPPPAAPLVATAADPLQSLEDAIAAEETSLTNLTGETQTLLNNASLATACFKDILGRYPQLLLTDMQRAALVSDLNNSPDCELQMQPWPTSEITAAINTGPAISNLFVQLSATISTNDSKGQLLTRHTAAQTGLLNLLTSSNISTLATGNDYVNNWQQRRAATLASSPAQWSPTVTLTCHPQWFGRTEQQVVSILYYDMSATAPTQQTMSLFTNSCLGAVTISSGIGISTVRSSTFAFTPKTDFSANPPTTTQVIGYSADSRVLPVYLGAMNYEFARVGSIGFDFAGGIGVSSSSAGTASDFFIGPSFAFVRRYIFVSPSFHLTQRQTLQNGYQVSNPQGSLTSVPTINRWRSGFALTFTFPVLQSP